MQRKLIAASVLGMILSSSAFVASADHNSPWGEDWATDMMDVHDARFDSLGDDSVDGSAFLADSLITPGGGGSRPDTAGSAAGGGMGGAR